MSSMNYLGRVFNNVKEFYNEINGATLTGAIDVVVVEQPDGSFTCSPFHVRFGKLGVLRSRFKVVDLELNGEPLNIHMKLGETGEAFFVEEVPENEVEYSAHLATSPIPDNGFTLYQEQSLPPRRNSADFGLDKYQNQVSDYTQRRYTDGQGTQKANVGVQKRDYKLKDKSYDNQIQSSQEQMFAMDDETKMGTLTAKMFRAEEVNDKESRAKDVVRKISINNDFKSIANEEISHQDTLDAKASSVDDISLQISIDDSQKPLSGGNNKKKKKTKKSGSKKKNAQRKSSTSSNGYSSQSETLGSEILDSEKIIDKVPAEAICDKELISNSSFMMKNIMQDVHFFSDTDITVPELRRGKCSRSGTPVQSDSELELARGSGVDGSSEPGQSWRWGELPSPLPMTKSAVSLTHPPATESISSDDENIKSIVKDDVSSTNVTSQASGTSMLSGMFNFMKHPRGSAQVANVGEGVYLAELETGAIEPEVAALYFPSHVQGSTSNQNVPRSLPLDISNNMATEEDYESGNGPSLPQSPSSVDGIMNKGVDSDEDDIKIFCKGYVGLSLCGPSCLDQPAAAVAEAFEQDAVRFETLCTDSSLLQNPRLVVRIGEKYMPWTAAAPALLSLIVYHRQLPKNVLKNLVVEREESQDNKSDDNILGNESKSQQRSGGFTWWNWRRSADKQTRDETTTERAVGEPTIIIEKAQIAETEYDTMEAPQTEQSGVIEPKTQDIDIPKETIAVSTQTSFPSLSATGEGYSGSQSSEDSDEGITDKGLGNIDTISLGKSHSSKLSDRFRKTLRLSSTQIASLNLHEGMNEMVFSVTTAYQGTSRCKCHVFRWRYDDKIVISDIDGTITKSDVLGHIFPLVGKDWAQSGVAQLFTKIKNNGYKLLYLSARAIGQAKLTREYLRSIKQGDLSLPDGPLLLNPTSLIRAFHREVIEKKPEEFKIQCLSDIMALFPEDYKPFYAGYGNRVNDVCAYQTVGIPIVRIFTINYKGELKHELTQTFQSTYSNMSYIVDHLFPPVRADVCEDYSQFVYWRQPIADLNELLPPPVSQFSLPPIPEGSSD